MANHKREFYAYKKLKTPPEKGVKHHEGKIAEESIPVYVPEDKHHQKAKGGNRKYLQVIFAMTGEEIKYDRRRKIKAFLHSERPALRHSCKYKIVEKAAYESDMHEKQSNDARKILND